MIRLLFSSRLQIKFLPDPVMTSKAASSASDQNPPDAASSGCLPQSQMPASGDAQMKRIDVILNTIRNRRISLSALHALTNLYLHRPCKPTLSELADNLGLTTAAVTSVADALERLGFASRFFDHHDRRRTRLSLTPRGHAFAEWISDSMRGVPEVNHRGTE